MANRTIKIFGHTHAADTAFTVSWDGTQVFNGAISGTVCDYADIYDISSDIQDPEELCEFTYSNTDDTAESNHTLSITVSAGEACVGLVYDICNNDNAIYEGYPADNKPQAVEIDSKWYWLPTAPGGVYSDGSAINSESTNLRINLHNFAIDGNAIVPADIIGAPADYTFPGYMHHLTTGQVFTADVRVAKTLPAYIA